MNGAASPSAPVDPAGWRLQIQQALETALAGPPTELLRAARYVVLSGGHRWRGLLTMAAGRLFHPAADAPALTPAAAVELLHAASLVLDDLPSMDDARERRGRPCVHLVFPRWVADMLPAFLVNRAYWLVAGAAEAPDGCRLRVLQLMGRMGTALARGQELDMEFKIRPVTDSERFESYALKSGALFAVALAGGALWMGAGPAAADMLHDLGLKLGQAYQLLDDLADLPEDGPAGAARWKNPAGILSRARALLDEIHGRAAAFGAAAAPLLAILGELAGMAHLPAASSKTP